VETPSYLSFNYALGGNRTPILRTGILRAIRCTTFCSKYHRRCYTNGYACLSTIHYVLYLKIMILNQVLSCKQTLLRIYFDLHFTWSEFILYHYSASYYLYYYFFYFACDPYQHCLHIFCYDLFSFFYDVFLFLVYSFLYRNTIHLAY
jgi:hypothetical protein